MTDETSQAEAAETTLVRQAQAGDAGAFERLVRAYHRRAISLAYRLLSHHEDALDVAQEAFVRAYKSLAQLDAPERFGAWLLRIVGNLALNYRRARATRRTASLDDAMAAGHEPEASTSSGRRRAAEPAASHGVSSGELHDAITEAMEQLPDAQRLALVLFSVEGMPQKQVAQVLECSIEMVKWNVFQARKKLKEMLSEFL